MRLNEGRSQAAERGAGSWLAMIYRALISDGALLLLLALTLLVVLIGGVAMPALRPADSGLSVAQVFDRAASSQTALSTLLLVLTAACLASMTLRALNLLIPGWRPPPLRWRILFTRDGCVGETRETLVAAWPQARGGSLAAVRSRTPSQRLWCERSTARERWLAALFLLGCALILSGGLLQRLRGWTGPVRAFRMGQEQSLGTLSGDVGRLERLIIKPQSGGGDHELMAEISVSRGADAPQTVRLGYGYSAALAGYRLFLVGHEPAIRVTARDRASNERLTFGIPGEGPFALDSERFVFSITEQERLLALPEQDMLVRLTYYPAVAASDDGGPGLQVQVAQGAAGALIADELLTRSAVLTVGDVLLDIGFEYAVKTQARSLPGRLPLISGVLLALLGLPVVATPRRTALWLLVDDRERGSTCTLLCARRSHDPEDLDEVRELLGKVCDAQ